MKQDSSQGKWYGHNHVLDVRGLDESTIINETFSDEWVMNFTQEIIYIISRGGGGGTLIDMVYVLCACLLECSSEIQNYL